MRDEIADEPEVRPSITGISPGGRRPLLFWRVRFEDVYRVTPSGGEVLWPYPILPELAG